MNTQAVSYAIEYASLRARLLSATAGFPPSEIDDARQDLLFDCVRRWTKFDRGRGDSDGFIRGVMRNHTTVLITRRSRRIRHEVPANELSEPESKDAMDVLEIIHRSDPTNGLDEALDVRRILRQLPTHLQHIATLLPDMSIDQIGIATGKSRSWMYLMLGQLRVAFVQAGLRPDPSNVPVRRHRRRPE